MPQSGPRSWRRSPGRWCIPVPRRKPRSKVSGRSRWRGSLATQACWGHALIACSTLSAATRARNQFATRPRRSPSPFRSAMSKWPTSPTRGDCVSFMERGDIGLAEAELDDSGPPSGASPAADLRNRDPALSHHAGIDARSVGRGGTSGSAVDGAAARHGIAVHEDQLSVLIFTLRREQGRLAELRSGGGRVPPGANGCLDLAARTGPCPSRGRSAGRRTRRVRADGGGGFRRHSARRTMAVLHGLSQRGLRRAR